MFCNINFGQKYLDDKIKVRNFALAFEKEACSAEAQQRGGSRKELKIVNTMNNFLPVKKLVVILPS